MKDFIANDHVVLIFSNIQDMQEIKSIFVFNLIILNTKFQLFVSISLIFMIIWQGHLYFYSKTYHHLFLSKMIFLKDNLIYI